MPDLDHLRIDGTTYDLKDSTAREKNAVQDNELNSVKNAIDKFDNPIVATTDNPSYTSGIVSIVILKASAANYDDYRIRVVRKNSTWHWYMSIQGYTASTETWTNVGTVESAYDAEASYPRVETLIATNGTFAVTLDWNYVTNINLSESSLDVRLKNNIVFKPFTTALANIASLQTTVSTLSTTTGNLTKSIGDLESEIGPWLFYGAQYSDWIRVQSTQGFSSGDIIYVKPLSSLNVTGNIWINGVSGSTETNIGNVAVGSSVYLTLAANYDAIYTSYHLTAVDPGTTVYYSVIAKVGENGTIGGTVADVLRRTAILEANEQMYDSPFSVPVPDSIAGIVSVNVYNKNFAIYREYRLNRVTHNSSWYMYAQLQGYNGSSWENIDNWEISASAATSPQPTVELLDAKYHRATMTVIWANIGSSINLTNQDFRLKDTIINLTQIAIKTDIATLKTDVKLPSYELADWVGRTKVITVKQDGSGDYTTISAAYAAITDSAFDNQYEIVVYPGTYSENNLIPPPYTHTHGIFPMKTIVDSTGLYDSDHPDYSVFDQKNAPSKLSNMVIKSQTKYCVHQDIELYGITLVNENLYCQRLPGGNPNNSAVIGIGADFGGAKFIWRNCTFVDGEVGAHTNPNSDPNANQHIIYDNCKFVNAWVWLGVAGNTYGNYVCEINNCKANAGNGGLRLKAGAALTGIDVNFPWQIIGSGNNFAPRFWNNAGTETDVYWDAVNTTEKTFVSATASITSGKFVTLDGKVANNSTPLTMIAGYAISDGSSGDLVPIWKSAIKTSESDGEYGLDASGSLSSSADVKIGRVFSGYFYPYY